MAVPSDSAVTGNLLFPLIMITLTLAAVVVTVYHPIAWSDDEMRLAVGGPAVLGILIVLGAIGLGRADASVVAGPLILQPLTLGFALVVLGLLVYATFQVAGRYGVGPMARPAGSVTADGLVLPPAAAAGRGLAAAGLRPRAADRVDGRVPARDPARRLRRAVRAVGVRSTTTSCSTGWPTGHTGPDARRPHRRDVPLPQQPDRGRMPRARRGGPGRSTSSRSGSTRARSRTRPPPRSTTPATWSSGGWASRRWRSSPYQAFRRRSLRPRPDPHRLPVPVGQLGADRPGVVPVPLLHEPAVRGHRRSATSSAELWHGPRAGRGCSPGSPRRTALMGPVILWLLRLPLCGIAGVGLGERRARRRATARPATSS